MNMGQMIDDVRLAINVQPARSISAAAPAASFPPRTRFCKQILKSWREVRSNGIVFQKPNALTDVPLHYCPGCTHGIIHRLVAEVHRRAGHRGQDHRRRAGRLLGSGV